jgi:hypothetical protein
LGTATPQYRSRDRRYEGNKIFVQYLSLVELAISAVAYNPFLAIPLGLALLAGALLTHLSNHWWTILSSSFGLSGAGVLACCIIRYEQHNGPLYYQYNNEGWSPELKACSIRWAPWCSP